MHIPEFNHSLSLSEMNNKLANPYLVTIAEAEGKLAGFKVGYVTGASEFYSWLGGVLPQYRSHGIAQKLLEFQENWAISAGLKTIRVKSMNRFPSMLRLLIKNGYKIKSIENFGNKESERIEFIKVFSAHSVH
jgi:GNAT superfamily N-acetyltransferase